MRSIRARIEDLEQGAPSATVSTPNECICFPSDEQPSFGSAEEREKAAAIRCPVHGERFRPDAPLVYKAAWLRKREKESGWPYAGPQYQKAMLATYGKGETR